MVSADGITERQNTIARLQTVLTGVSVYPGAVPDTEQLPRNQVTGAILPYVVVKFAGPIPTRRGRGLAWSEAEQPAILALQAICYSYSDSDLNDTVRSVTAALLGWQPSDGATQYASAGGYAFNTASPTNKPTRLEEAISFQSTINLDALDS